MSSWVLYILECADGTYYTGITNDLEKRVAAHEAGMGAKYTRGRGPLTVVYQEMCDDRSHASQREIYVKKLSREDKVALIQGHAVCAVS